MGGPKPKRIIAEFDDNSRREVDFDVLPFSVQSELLRQPFLSQFSPNPEREKFVLLEWTDGWKEVMEVESSCTKINRYYVITRPEDVGRLSINKEDGYPELIEIFRSPMDLKRITFLDTFELEVENSSREGKKTDHFFKLEKKGNALADLKREFVKAIAERGVRLQDLQLENRDQLERECMSICREIGIKAAQSQRDVFDFIMHLVLSTREERN